MIPEAVELRTEAWRLQPWSGDTGPRPTAEAASLGWQVRAAGGGHTYAVVTACTGRDGRPLVHGWPVETGDRARVAAAEGAAAVRRYLDTVWLPERVVRVDDPAVVLPDPVTRTPAT